MMSNEDKDWKQMDEHTDDDLSAMINLSDISKIRSQNPLLKIKKNLMINMLFGLAVSCCYIIIIICFAYWQVRLAMILVLCFSIWALITALNQYRSIDSNVIANGPVLTELKRQQQSIVGWMHSQARVALFIYPISAAGGFMLGGAEGSGKSVAVFMSKPVIWLIFVIVVAILVPLCHQLAKWMCKRSFGKHLEDLQQYIAELESEK